MKKEEQPGRGIVNEGWMRVHGVFGKCLTWCGYVEDGQVGRQLGTRLERLTEVLTWLGKCWCLI